MLNKLRAKVMGFIESKEQAPILTAIAAGLYPVLNYYNNNFLAANSWSQLTWFLVWFILVPIVLTVLGFAVTSRIGKISGYKNHILTGLNLFVFGALLLKVTSGLNKTYLLILCCLVLALAFLLHRHLKKIVVFQLLLALIALVSFCPKLYRYLGHSNDWLHIDDSITSTKFKIKPNIYMIQPDGYSNFSEMDKGHYNFDNTQFKEFLNTKGFKVYDNFRSNYYSTLTSNASMFAMKHHYFLGPKGKGDDYYDYRQVLAGNSSALRTLKHNGYKTFLLLDYPYMIINRPTKDVDYINFSYENMAHLSNDWKGKEPMDELAKLISEK